MEEPNTEPSPNQIDQPQQTQGETTNPMDNQQETKEKILRVMTGALSVLSYPPVFSSCLSVN
jgi:hypothetical protein